MKIMDAGDPRYRQQGFLYLFRVYRRRCSLHQNMNGILYDSPGALQNQDRHKDGYDRVRNVPSEGHHHDPGDDGSYRAERIANNVEVSAEIHIVLYISCSHQEPGTEKVSQQADGQ